MQTHCLQTNETQHCLGKESALGAIAGGERVVLIKSLISEDALGAQGCQVQLKSSADITKLETKVDIRNQSYQTFFRPNQGIML